MDNYKKKQNKKFSVLTLELVFLVVIVFCISMNVGRYSISFLDVFKFFTGQTIGNVENSVLTNLRIPRTIVAMLVGIALSVSGAIFQSVFNNKLVSPDILGVTSGSSVGACLGILIGFSSGLISLTAFIFGFLTVILTVLISKMFKNKSNIILILSGLAVGGLMSSLVGLMKYLADSEAKLSEMTFWLLGDLSGSTYNHILVLLPIVIVGCIISIILSFKLNIVSLGRKESISLGVNYNLIIILMVIIATALTAVSVSICGTIGWIGLVIPNIVRLIVGSDNRKVIPTSILVGALFMMVTDMLARTLAPNEIPLSVITGIIGTPLFLFSIFKKRREIQ